MAAAPPCPITGQPGSTLLEDISSKLLGDLWRWGAGVDTAPIGRDHPRIGLWRSPAGLLFFHPVAAGSAAFYASLYRRFDAHGLFARHAAQREDFLAGAALAQPGDRVLDVGCGDAAFAALLPPGARYQGLDPNGTARAGGPAIARESLAEHARQHAGRYDLVCGFQVLEHVEQPLGFARDLAACLKPGGLLVLAMPIYPSPQAMLPNNLVNLPPHHLSWWTAEAGAALCAQLGLAAERIGALPASRWNAPMAWAARLCPRRYRPLRHVQRGFGAMLAMLLGWWLGRLLAMLFGLPRGSGPVDLLVVGRKPPAGNAAPATAG